MIKQTITYLFLRRHVILKTTLPLKILFFKYENNQDLVRYNSNLEMKNKAS